MPRKFFRKYLPDAQSVRSSRLAGVFGRWLHHHPNLWYLNRRSVAGAVAVGLFCGLVPGPLQMLSALLLAIPLRANIPVALLAIFYTNPLTIVPLYIVAYQYGLMLLGGGHGKPHVEPLEMDWAHIWDSLLRSFDWTLSLGKPLALGLPALGLTLAVLGYFAVQLAWRASVTRAWRARRRARRAKAPAAS